MIDEKYTLAFDTENTEVYERVGGSDVFRVRLTEAEALEMYQSIRHKLERDGVLEE